MALLDSGSGSGAGPLRLAPAERAETPTDQPVPISMLPADPVAFMLERKGQTPVRTPKQSTRHRSRKQSLTSRPQVATIALDSPLRFNTIAVRAAKGGVGSTTVAAYLALLLAAERKRPAAALDVHVAVGDLSWMLAGTGTRGQATDNPLLAVDEGFAFAAARDERDFVLTDVGTASETELAAGILRASAVQIVVGAPNRSGVRSIQSVVNAMTARNVRSRIVVVFNGSPAETVSAVADATSAWKQRGIKVVHLPFDESAGSGEQVARLSDLSAESQAAYRQLASVVVDSLRVKSSRSQAGRPRTTSLPTSSGSSRRPVPSGVFNQPTHVVSTASKENRNA